MSAMTLNAFAATLLVVGLVCAVGTLEAKSDQDLPVLAEPGALLSLEGTSPHEAALVDDVLVAVLIERDGRLGDWLVISDSRPGQIGAALAALRNSTFAPGTRNGFPAAQQLGLVFAFSADPPQIWSLPIESLDAGLGRRSQDRPRLRCFLLDRLDRQPRLIEEVRPAIRVGLGTVRVQYFIDEEGRVRLPAVLSAQDDDLAKAVIAAVKQWRFTPPLHQGKRVIAFTRQEFRFLGK